MSLALFYDTETTGLPLWKEPSGDPRQPHLVQIAALLVDLETRQVVEEFSVLVKPDGWTIPDDVVTIHGITTEHALEHGIPESEALARFLALHELADERIGHVESFDMRMVRIAIKRFRDDAQADAWKAQPAQCTGKLAKAALGMNKMPKLTEAHQQLLGTAMTGAHEAMADTRGCMDVFFACADRAAQPA
jgi:DNA polymerase-3 subunit epsilon